MSLRDLAAFFEDDGLEYPLPAGAFDVPAGTESPFPDGKTYVVPSPSAKVGLWLTSLAEIGIKASSGAELTPDDIESLKLDDDKERSLYQRVLGPVYDEMLADGVKWTALQKVGQDAYLCFATSQETADAALSSLGKAPANRAARRAVGKRTAGRKSAQASSATATRTRRQASTG